MRRLSVLFTLALAIAPLSGAQSSSPITYRVTFPEPEHHWLQVELTVTDLGSAPLKARMSRSSPGRYAVHEFAKNVFSLEAANGRGQKLAFTRPNVDEWDIAGHDGTVKLTYKIFGDHADGTYMGVDTTHAHMNMPATFMWGEGLEMRPIRISFVPPAGSTWKVGTQLMPTNDPMAFTAPNLQYFMDSPTELADWVTSSFSVPNTSGGPAQIRLFVHSDGSQADVDELAKTVERLVREHMAVYGEFPVYEPGYYTFLLDYVEWGDGDGMEHRNSTSISSPGLSLRSPQGKRNALGTISHEYFHNWNVERIRPVGLEPFDFTRENITCCLWLAEGFTQYYGPLLIQRAGLGGNPPFGGALAIINGSGRQVRSAVQMSEHAAFADAGVSVDTNDRSRTFISYYTYGAALALALDLSLRDMSQGKTSLDDFMRALWVRHGKPADPRPGYVAKPYSLADLRTVLADVSGNKTFANEFFDKYVEGREVPDYARLFAAVGYTLKPRNASAAWTGQVQLQPGNGGLRVMSLAPLATPVYDAGVDLGDVIVSIDGQPATQQLWQGLTQKKPGDQVKLTIRRRGDVTVEKTLTLKPDPALVVEPVETAGTLTPAQKALRDGWLNTKVK